jgi:hypothetical protein
MQTSTNNLNKTQALLQISFCLAVEKRAIYYFNIQNKQKNKDVQGQYPKQA